MAEVESNNGFRRQLPGLIDQPIWVWAVIGGVALLVVGALVAVLIRRNSHDGHG